jgi:hypothetical protein
MADNIVLSEEEVIAIKAAAVVVCQEAVASYEAMTPEQQAAHEAAQAARNLAAFLAMSPEQQAMHESADKAASEAANEAYTAASLLALAAMADASPGLHL